MTDQTTPDSAPEAGATPAGTDTPPAISEPQGGTTEATGTVPAPYTLMTIDAVPVEFSSAVSGKVTFS